MQQSHKPTGLYIGIGFGAFALVVGGIVAGNLITDEIRKAEIRSAIQDVRQQYQQRQQEAVQHAQQEIQQTNAAGSVQRDIDATENSLRAAQRAMNAPINAATPKEEVEESGRRFNEVKRLERRLAELKAQQ